MVCGKILFMNSIIIFAVICFIIAIVFFEVGMLSLLTKKTTEFLAGEKIDSNKVKDIKKYNLINGLMWIFFGVPYLIFAGLVFCVNIFFIGIVFAAWTVLIIPVLIVVTKINRKKYFKS